METEFILKSANRVAELETTDLKFLEETLRINGYRGQVMDRAMLVFSYPGIGVGRTYPEMSGCTDQVGQLRDAYGVLEEKGVGLLGLSTENRADRIGLGPLPFKVLKMETDLSGLFPFVTRDGSSYLKRLSYLALPDGRLFQYQDITDAKTHAQDLIRLICGLKQKGVLSKAA